MIEFQCFDDCPNSEETLANLRGLVAEGFLTETEIIVSKIAGPEEAEKARFQGSPSILVDGLDIYLGTPPSSSSFTCRVYSIDGKRGGVLGREYIRRRIEELRMERRPLEDEASAAGRHMS